MTKRIQQNAVVIEPDGTRRRIKTVGRFAQTLRALKEAGPRGITSLDVGGWAVRLSHYVFVLRREYGLRIHMEMEEHGGPYPGKHGRYRLLSKVVLVDEHEEAP